MDDAERRYGRMEDWPSLEDSATKEQLVVLLCDYVKDLIEDTRSCATDALRYKSLLTRRQEECRTYVASALVSPHLLQTWTLPPKRKIETPPPPTEQMSGGVTAVEEPVPKEESSNDTEEQQLRRERGGAAVLDGTAAAEGLHSRELRPNSFSAFPFLRQRALDDREGSLDPSLVKWAEKYFPDDTEQTFSAPPVLRHPDSLKQQDVSESSKGPTTLPSPQMQRMGKPKGVKPKCRLRMTLTQHENTMRTTFDGQGVYFKIKRNAYSGESNEHKPKLVRGSDLHRSDKLGDVVKVDWATAAKSRGTVKTPEVLRAKERLIRLTRGEDPSSI
jgi:hypothetical protein